MNIEQILLLNIEIVLMLQLISNKQESNMTVLFKKKTNKNGFASRLG